MRIVEEESSRWPWRVVVVVGGGIGGDDLRFQVGIVVVVECGFLFGFLDLDPFEMGGGCAA